MRTLIAIAALLVCLECAADDPLPQGILALEAHAAPGFTLKDIDGNAFDLESTRGRWVFLHFWASWCVPCRREFPAIQRMVGSIAEQPIDVVLVNTAEDADTIFTFLAEYAPDLSSLMDRDGHVTEVWQPRGLPATYLVDPGGRVHYQALGGRPWDESGYLAFLRELTERP